VSPYECHPILWLCVICRCFRILSHPVHCSMLNLCTTAVCFCCSIMVQPTWNWECFGLKNLKSVVKWTYNYNREICYVRVYLHIIIRYYYIKYNVLALTCLWYEAKWFTDTFTKKGWENNSISFILVIFYPAICRHITVWEPFNGCSWKLILWSFVIVNMFKFWLKLDDKNGHFTCWPACVPAHIWSVTLLRIYQKNFSNKL
jgi:hypothetical protein